MNFDDYEFRCHSFGNIMVEPKEKSNMDKYIEACEKRDKAQASYQKHIAEYDLMANKETKTAINKSEAALKALDRYEALKFQCKALYLVKDVKELSDTCKSYLIDLFVTEKYGRKKIIKSKYLEKGNIMEEDAITQYALATETYFEKNTERRSNGVLNGETDFRTTDEYIRDTKVSWDIYTFFANLEKALNPIYYWQQQGYMWLWEKPKAKLIFTLVDTPRKLIDMEKKKLLNDFIGSEEQYEMACADLEKRMIYADIPVDEKIIEIDIERNEEHIARIEPRVIECREFMNELNNSKLIFKNKNNEYQTRD